MVLFITSVIVVTFVLIGIYHIMFRMRELKNRVIKDADLFVQLVNDEIGKAFEMYFYNTFFKFRSVVLEQSRHNSDLTDIQIINLDGRILYDMNRTESASFPMSEKEVATDTLLSGWKNKQRLAMI
ncbi:MAG: hypothetical protein ACUVTF_06725 [bacterium]